MPNLATYHNCWKPLAFSETSNPQFTRSRSFLERDEIELATSQIYGLSNLLQKKEPDLSSLRFCSLSNSSPWSFRPQDPLQSLDVHSSISFGHGPISMSNKFLNIIIPDPFHGCGDGAVPSSLVEGYFDPHFIGNSVPEFSCIGFRVMPTIFVEHKGRSNMPGEFQQGFFEFSIKRENFYAIGFGGWSKFIQRQMSPDHYPVVFKIQTFPKYKVQSLKELSLHQYRINEV
jgi:hypothetical protein